MMLIEEMRMVMVKGVMSKVKDRMMATVLGVMVLMMARMMTDLWIGDVGGVGTGRLRDNHGW